MTHFATSCVGCGLKSNCTKLSMLKGWSRGLGISSLKHRCEAREPEHKPGEQVSVFTDADLSAPIGPDGEGRVRAWFRGTVINEHRSERTKIIVFVRPGTRAECRDSIEFSTNGRGFIKITRSRVKRLDLPPIKISECGMCSAILPLTDCNCEKARPSDMSERDKE